MQGSVPRAFVLGQDKVVASGPYVHVAVFIPLPSFTASSGQSLPQCL